jgi:hypothetical protein
MAGWFSKKDVLDVFRVVSQEIRAKCRRFASEGPTQAEACILARRIKDQRDLIRQISEKRDYKHTKRLMRLNRKHRERLVKLVEAAGLDASVLIFK